MPFDELSGSDERFFNDTITKVVDLSENLVENSLKTSGDRFWTIFHVVYDTQALVRFFSKTDFISWNPTIPGDLGQRPLAMSMGWLDSHNLIWLPVGLKPFHERPNTPALRGITRMRHFLDEIRKRINIDKMSVVALQGDLHTLVEYSDEMDSRASHCILENSMARIIWDYRGWYGVLELIGARVIRRHRRWFDFLMLISEKDLSKWMSERRLESLESFCRGQIDYLNATDTRLGQTLQTLNNMDEALLAEAIAVRRGMRLSSWVLEQPEIMQKGAATLETQLEV